VAAYTRPYARTGQWNPAGSGVCCRRDGGHCPGVASGGAQCAVSAPPAGVQGRERSGWLCPGSGRLRVGLWTNLCGAWWHVGL